MDRKTLCEHIRTLTNAYAKTMARVRLLIRLGERYSFFKVVILTSCWSNGPFTQPGTLEGTPIKSEASKDWVPVHLEDSLGAVRWCWARRSLARDIAQHIFTSVIRVDGTARWLRKRDGEWDMVSFRAKGFTVLDSDITLRESIDHLRAIPAKWKELDDPLGELKKIRHGT